MAFKNTIDTFPQYNLIPFHKGFNTHSKLLIPERAMTLAKSNQGQSNDCPHLLILGSGSYAIGGKVLHNNNFQ
jgi:hypothetical protein